MKKINVLLAIMLLSMCSCDVNNNPTADTSSSGGKSENAWNIYDEDYSSLVDLNSLNDPTAKEFLPDDGSYESPDLAYDDVKYFEKYVNNKKVASNGSTTNKDDIKYVFYDNDSARLISMADGYAVSFPTNTTVVGDFTLGKYRSKIYNEESTLTISKESSNTYSTWELYRDEWLIKFFTDKYINGWMERNNLSLTRNVKVFENKSILQNFSVTEYCIKINDPGLITKPYYNIGIIRKSSSIKDFYLLVMKSSVEKNAEFDNIIKSFTEVDKYGEPNNNTLLNMDIVQNPIWNEKTKNYYEKLCTQNTTDWGFYAGNLPLTSDTAVYASKKKKYTTAFQVDDFEIISSYAHVSFSGGFNSGRFPKEAAAVECGDGTDGKPVLQFNYQFTDNNNDLGGNNIKNNFSPLIEILRGDNGDTLDFDSYQNDAAYHLNKLAKDIKEYGKPVLFRLNNEMNTDWTSYCGMINLLDPDLFAASWRVLYKIFEDNQVDNCIWIFNPFTPSYPYSSWGEDLCYFPGKEYVQVLGLTYYVMNNDNDATYKSFQKCYTEVYNKNKDVWNKYPWIISEFGCGAGGSLTGELYRNKASQAQWVSDMFTELKTRPDYCKNIKGAVWFSVNDFSDSKISNALEIVFDKEPETVAAFIEGLKKD